MSKTKEYEDKDKVIYRNSDKDSLLADIIGHLPDEYEAHGKGDHYGESAKGSTVGEARHNFESGQKSQK